VIHPVQASTMQNAINRHLTKAFSLHLLIAQDGKQIAQMVDFDHMAVHANDFDNNSLSIGLIYPGYLTDKPGFFTQEIDSIRSASSVHNRSMIIRSVGIRCTPRSSWMHYLI
jgi:N-acetyl-anhydromuramyl-L-alanine amidase AmpD